MYKFLIVDDEPAIRDVLKFFLEDKGFEVFLANDAHEALSIFRDKSPDVVFLDLLLPGGKTGKDILQEIRKSEPSDGGDYYHRLLGRGYPDHYGPLKYPAYPQKAISIAAR